MASAEGLSITVNIIITEIREGDTVDCTSASVSAGTCERGTVTIVPAPGDDVFFVKGPWSDGAEGHCVRFHQITNHVPTERNKMLIKYEHLRCRVEAAINATSSENGSHTPDFILADYLVDCLAAFDKATQARDKWYGIHAEPGNTHLVREPSSVVAT